MTLTGRSPGDWLNAEENTHNTTEQGAEQVDLHKPTYPAAGVQVFHRLAQAGRRRAHGDHHVSGSGAPYVVEQVVFPSGDGV
jgi:hypothetical protein